MNINLSNSIRKDFIWCIRRNILISSQTIKPWVIQWLRVISVVGHVRTLYVWWSSSHQHPIQAERGEFIGAMAGRDSDSAAFSTIYWLAVTAVLPAINNPHEISTVRPLFRISLWHREQFRDQTHLQNSRIYRLFFAALYKDIGLRTSMPTGLLERLGQYFARTRKKLGNAKWNMEFRALI